MWSPVPCFQAGDLGSEQDAESVDDGGYEYQRVEAEVPRLRGRQDVVFHTRDDHDSDGQSPFRQLHQHESQVLDGDHYGGRRREDFTLVLIFQI